MRALTAIIVTTLFAASASSIELYIEDTIIDEYYVYHGPFDAGYYDLDYSLSISQGDSIDLLIVCNSSKTDLDVGLVNVDSIVEEGSLMGIEGDVTYSQLIVRIDSEFWVVIIGHSGSSLSTANSTTNSTSDAVSYASYTTSEDGNETVYVTVTGELFFDISSPLSFIEEWKWVIIGGGAAVIIVAVALVLFAKFKACCKGACGDGCCKCCGKGSSTSTYASGLRGRQAAYGSSSSIKMSTMA